MHVKLNDQPDGTYLATYEWRTYRFLLDDGRTIDVRAVIDDSVLRGAVLKTTQARSINGVAQLPEEEEAKPVKRTPAKKIGQQRAG
jgi:hypothetical protein